MYRYTNNVTKSDIVVINILNIIIHINLELFIPEKILRMSILNGYLNYLT